MTVVVSLQDGRREQSPNTARAGYKSTGVTKTAEIEMDGAGTPGGRSRADRNICYLYINAMRRMEMRLKTKLEQKMKANE